MANFNPGDTLALGADNVYRDYSGILENGVIGLPDNFPSRLYRMIEDAEQREMSHVISWQPHGEERIHCFFMNAFL